MVTIVLNNNAKNDRKDKSDHRLNYEKNPFFLL